jgi:hypothetical protein
MIANAINILICPLIDLAPNLLVQEDIDARELVPVPESSKFIEEFPLADRGQPRACPDTNTELRRPRFRAREDSFAVCLLRYFDFSQAPAELGDGQTPR